MTTKSPSTGAWTLIRVCPWNAEQIIMGVFPEHKAALYRLEHVMDHPDDNEEYKIEYHVFKSEEDELESLQKCKQARKEYAESQARRRKEKEEEKVILPEDA